MYVIVLKDKKLSVITIEIVYGKIRNIKDVKQGIKKAIICPYCDCKIEIGVEIKEMQSIRHNKELFFPHINLHGNPLHGLLCYLNSELEIRNIGIIKSVEISRDSETFAQIMKKWSNPY